MGEREMYELVPYLVGGLLVLAGATWAFVFIHLFTRSQP
jgi:hypothetical protein